jgi:UDP-N-acetylmuramoyl-L-alanyl-D-glutamate--2,6-diaminopimelate ligase
MKVKLKQLIKGIPFLEVKGSKEVEITGLCNNSKLAVPGSLFFAKKGEKYHGNSFIPEVKAAGCAAVATDMFDPFLKDIVQIIHPDIRALEPLIAERFYGYPSKKLLCVGITGTNGKTTTSYLIKHLFDALDLPAGLIGTIEWIIKNTVLPSRLTTPDIITNQKLLNEMVSVGCKSVVMEVSSHALDQKRVAGIDFDIAIFTNLTEDHLDYHSSMEEYASAKAKLFASLSKNKEPGKSYPKFAIINQDCMWYKEMIENLTVSLLTYGISSDADVRAQNIQLHPHGSECQICYKDQVIPFRTSLIGKFNISNSLAVAATAIALGIDLSKALSILSSFKAVPGRLEKVENKLNKNIFVDYAHTEDALRNVLETLKELTKGRLLCVFGCGGNRDKQKRPKMGAVVEKLADVLFVTSDNPRGESPESIVEDILMGIQDKKKVCVEVDRRHAIEKAISQMKKDDVLLIAGKGHEDYQIFSNHTIHFDDRIVAKEYCR